MSKSNKYMTKILITLIIAFFMPTIIFYHDIEFDKILFVNSWLTAIGQGLVIAILFHFIIAHHLQTTQNEEDDNAIVNIIVILNEIIAIVEVNNIDTEDVKNKINSIEDMRLLIHDKEIKMKINNILIDKDFIKFKSMVTTTNKFSDNRYVQKILNETTKKMKQISNSN